MKGTRVPRQRLAGLRSHPSPPQQSLPGLPTTSPSISGSVRPGISQRSRSRSMWFSPIETTSAWTTMPRELLASARGH